MRAARSILLIVYVGYLIQVGLTLLMLPWVPLWSVLMLEMPLQLAVVLQSPFARGLVSAFGFLHLLMVSLEFFHAGAQAQRLRISGPESP